MQKSPFGDDDEPKEEAKKEKKRAEPPLTRDVVIRRLNNRHAASHESPLQTLQEIFEEADDKSRFVGDTMFWKYFEDIDIERVKDTKSVEYRNLKIMFYETIFYVVLLVIFTLYTELMHSTFVYQARKEQLDYWGGCDPNGFCKIELVTDMKSLWHWMKHEFVPTAFTSYPVKPPIVANIETTFPGNEFTLHFHPRFVGPARNTVLLGSIRMRALRVQKNKGCHVSKLFSHVFPDCYGQYSNSYESKAVYRPRFVPTYLEDAYKYVDAKETNQISILGQMAEYPGGGFMVDLPLNHSESLIMMDDLREFAWIDRATRAIIIELSTLNTNVNVITNSRILFELGPTGSVQVSQQAQAAQVFHFTPSTKSGASANVFGIQLVLLMFFIVYACWVGALMYKTMHNFIGSGTAHKEVDPGEAAKEAEAQELAKMDLKFKILMMLPGGKYIVKEFLGVLNKSTVDKSTNQDPEEEKKSIHIWILYNDAYKIVGKKGSTLDRIEAKSNCRVTVMPDDSDQPREERWVEIFGYARDRTKGLKQVLAKVKFARDHEGRVMKDTRNDPNIVLKGLSLMLRTLYHYLRYEWNMVDFLIIVLFIVHMGYRCDVYKSKGDQPNLAPMVLGHPEKFMPFSRVMAPMVTGNQVLAVLSILVWVKLFKYLCMIGYFRLLIRILESCAKELIVYTMILLAFFFGFAVCFFVAFGSYEQDFSTISGSFLVLFFLLIDGYRVDALWFSPGRLQIMPLAFFCYISIVYFVLLNVFLAIVLDVYSVTSHLYVMQHKKTEGKPNPMATFVYVYWNMMRGQSLIVPTVEDSLRSDDLKIELKHLPGLVRRKWIEKKRKMQRVANESFAGLVLFPEDAYYLKEGNQSSTDWMLPNSRLDIERMQNPGSIRPSPVYDVPESMLEQMVTRAQLQRLMDEDETLPLLLGTKRAVEVIQKFRRKTGIEDLDDENGDMKGVRDTQAEVFARIDDLERIPPELEVPEIMPIKKMTEEMSHALTDVQNNFRIQLTSIIEACAVLFEHLVELTQGIDSVTNNHQVVLELVHQDSSSGDSGSLKQD